MEKIVVEGTFAKLGSARWVIDAPELHAGMWPVHTFAGAAVALKLDDGCIEVLDLYISREAAERSLDPAYRAAMDEAKRRSGWEY